jgi:hypothetical protein
LNLGGAAARGCEQGSEDMNAVELDGCSLVVLMESGHGFRVLESGCLEYDGETLRFRVEDGSLRTLGEDEQRDILVVNKRNLIPQTAGYQLFVLRPCDA